MREYYAFSREKQLFITKPVLSAAEGARNTQRIKAFSASTIHTMDEGGYHYNPMIFLCVLRIPVVS